VFPEFQGISTSFAAEFRVFIQETRQAIEMSLNIHHKRSKLTGSLLDSNYPARQPRIARRTLAIIKRASRSTHKLSAKKKLCKA
jgi:hypothetical protein